MNIDNKRLQMVEQINALRLRLKNRLPTNTWRDLQGAAHDRAFVVAGATKADLLHDLGRAVDDAITKGLGIDWFRKQFDALVARHGWDYRGPRNWRTRVIFQTNMRTSYSAARWVQLNDPELVRIKPFLMYRHSGNAADPRPAHKAMDKLCFARADPNVKRVYPPKGFGCGCSMVAVSARDIKRMGGRMGKPPADFAPDEGWDYVPGESVASELGSVIESKVASLPPRLGSALTDEANEVASQRAAIDEVRAAGIKERAGEIEYAALLKNGKKIWMKRGGRRHVEFTDDEFDQMASADLIHNHPSSTSLSGADLELAAASGMRSIIAVGNDANVYRARTQVPLLDLKRSIKSVGADVRQTVLIRIRSMPNRGSDAIAVANMIKESERWYSHIINSILHKRNKIAYTHEIAWDVPDWVTEVIDEL